MITVTITIQKETMGEVLDALTDLEIRADDEIMHQCEEVREKLCASEDEGEWSKNTVSCESGGEHGSDLWIQEPNEMDGGE